MPFPQLAVVVYSRDVPRTLAFYATLGFAFGPDRHGDGPEHYACALGGAVLEIYPWRRKPDPTFLSDSSIRLTLEIDDFDLTVASLRPLARKIEPTPPREDAPRSVRVIDPDGNQVLLIDKETSTLH